MSALLGASAEAAARPTTSTDTTNATQRLPLSKIVPNAAQPRKQFESGAIEELTQSIREHGILQPLTVRLVGDKFELIAGERRWRAAQAAGLTEVPVIIRQATDREALEWALVENLQRADLNPLEEAEGYGQLARAFGLTQEVIAQRVGKSRAAVANALRLLSLPTSIRDWLISGKLTAGHAKAIAGLSKATEQQALAQRIIRDGLSVRQAEKWVEERRKTKKTANRAKRVIANYSAANLRDLERRLQQTLGTRVKLSGNAKSGKVEIHYFSSEELERVLKLMGLRSL